MKIKKPLSNQKKLKILSRLEVRLRELMKKRGVKVNTTK